MTTNPTGPCWSTFCIASFCDGIRHVDATGYIWTETQDQAAALNQPAPARSAEGQGDSTATDGAR